jgi:hypothetical protein
MRAKRPADGCKEGRGCLYKDLPTYVKRPYERYGCDTDVCIQAATTRCVYTGSLHALVGHDYECVQRDEPTRLHSPNGCNTGLPTASACQETY